MSIEVMKQALSALEAELSEVWTCNSYHPSIYPAMQALRTAIQQAESEPVAGPTTYQQRFTEVVSLLCRAAPPSDMVEGWLTPDADDHRLQEWAIEYAPNWSQGIGVLDAAHVMADQPAEGEGHETRNTHPAPGVPDNTACKSVQKRLEAQQPTTSGPVQADSSEYLRVIASLGAALRRLSFAAQTTGGTAGPDAELQSAIGQAEQALSLGGIGQAMFATPEPVWCVATGDRLNGEETYTHHDAYVPLADCFPLYTHPAPGVPDGYVLVPVEPTDEMMAEMLGPFIAINGDNRSAFIEAYPRMLTAAQAQKGQP